MKAKIKSGIYQKDPNKKQMLASSHPKTKKA